MQQAELYVNDILLDVPNDSLIALSYAVNSLADLKSVQGNISNSISLPDTANNRSALGYPDDINFNGAALIRRKLPCRYVQNGVDVIPNGNLRIVGSSKQSLKIVISSGNTDFFDLLSGKLRDLNFSEYDHIWDNNTVIASRLNTDGFIYPVINYGNIANNAGEIHGQAIAPNEMRPAIFAKTTVKKIVESVGYKLIDRISEDPKTNDIYQRLLTPFSDDKFTHAQRFIDSKTPNDLVAQLTTTYIYDDPGGSGSDYILGFDHIIQDLDHTFNGSHFTAHEIMTVDIDFTFDKIWSETYVGAHKDGADYQLHVVQSGIDNVITRSQTRINDSAPLPGGGFGHFRTEFTNWHVSAKSVVLKPGDQVYMNIGALYGCFQTVFPNVTLTISRVNEAIIFGEQVQVESVLPDMTCSDFLKYISFLFCATIQTDNVNKTVTLVPFSYIIQNLSYSVDWSEKVTGDGEDIDVQIGDYCQQNEARYAEDDNVSPKTFGNGSMYLDDQNLDAYQDIYDIPFAATLDSLVLGGNRTSNVNKIASFDDLGENGLKFTINTEKRIVLLNKQNTSLCYRNGSTIITTITDNAPFTYFTSTDGSPDLSMSNIFTRHYTDLINVLNDQRKLTCYLSLNEIDIQQLDFFKPVYISKFQCYFYISKITDFTGVKPCKVELIKLL